MPAPGLFSRSWRSFLLFRFGLLMMNVPLPKYTALYSLSLDFSAKTNLQISLGTFSV
jgi:hypothetical protein